MNLPIPPGEYEALVELENAIREFDREVELLEASEEGFDRMMLAATRKRMALARLDDVRGAPA